MLSRADPVTGDIVKTLPGVDKWGDTVYMRDQAQLRHYAFANDMINQVSTRAAYYKIF